MVVRWSLASLADHFSARAASRDIYKLVNLSFSPQFTCEVFA